MQQALNFNFTKWDSELQRARAADADALDEMVFNMLQDDYDTTQIRGLPANKLHSLVKLLEARTFGFSHSWIAD
jgi:response regulator of citrate/malate metabolism